jgi:hypothetical protein
MMFGTNTTNSAGLVLGFSAQDSSVSGLSQTSSQIMNLSATTSFHFQISNCSSGVRTLDGKNFTFVIPSLTPTPQLSYYEPSQQFPITFHVDATKTLNIRVIDDQFRVLNNMCSNWYMLWQKVC